MEDPTHKTRYPNKVVGYEPLGTTQHLPFPFPYTSRIPYWVLKGSRAPNNKVLGSIGFDNLFYSGLGFRIYGFSSRAAGTSFAAVRILHKTSKPEDVSQIQGRGN